MSGVALLGAREIRALAERVGVSPTKKWGQNFVIDANTVRRIVRIAEVAPGDRVLEVGPGFGSLTLGLLDVGAHVTAIEIDERCAQLLPETVAERAPDAVSQLRVIATDALRVESFPEATHLVANLPYNVSVPVLIRTLERVSSLRRAVVMVQAEVGERLAAPPGSRTYGSPSAKVSWFGAWKLAGAVPRGVFWPVPNVDSVLVAFDAIDPPGDEVLRAATFRIIDSAFATRRKMLRVALADVLGGGERARAVLALAGVDSSLRGEQLSRDAFVAIARADAESPAATGADPVS